MATPYDWSRFTVRVNVNATMEKLYRAWATRSGMEYWFLRLSEYKTPEGSLRGDDQLVRTGDQYKWRWHGWSDDMTEYGQILECNDKDHFKFSFGKGGNCTIRIYKEQDLPIVELVQENIPTDEEGMHFWHLGCKTGWTFFLANMKSLYEGGLDLRNRNVSLQQVINA